MTTTTTHEAHVATPTSAGVSWRHLSVHYVEMILAMVAGMVVLGTLRDLVGLSPAFDTQPVAWYLLMATDMSIGMAAWMRFRRHDWPGILEMCGDVRARRAPAAGSGRCAGRDDVHGRRPRR